MADQGAGLASADREVRADLEDVYSVGAFEGEEWETFGNVTDVEFDAAGNLYILDRDAGHVLVIAPSGEYVRTIARKGGGPGELTQPLGMAVLPDARVVVFDVSRPGFQLFAPDGEFLESLPMSYEDGIPTSDLLPTPDGRLLSFGNRRISFGPEGSAEEEPPGLPIDRFALDGTRDVVYRAWEPSPPEETDATTLASEGARFEFQMPRLRAFEPVLHVDLLSDGRLAVVDSVGYRIKLVGPDGTPGGLLERPIRPIQVTGEIEEVERARRLAALKEGGGQGMMMVSMDGGGRGGGVSIGQDAIRKMQEDRVSSMIFAREIPVVARMAVDAEDRIWVERAGPEPGMDGPTDLITPDGDYLGTIPAHGIRIPSAFGPDGLAAYIERDDLDVQHVRVVRVRGLLPG